MQGNCAHRTETFQAWPSREPPVVDSLHAEYASHCCSLSTKFKCAPSGDRHEQTSNVSSLHHQHPCLNIFNPCEDIVITIMSYMKSRTVYPLFIAEKFLSSGLFAGPPLLSPNLLHRVSL
jgi:hypothetical protein